MIPEDDIYKISCENIEKAVYVDVISGNGFGDSIGYKINDIEFERGDILTMVLNIGENRLIWYLNEKYIWERGYYLTRYNVRPFIQMNGKGSQIMIV